jgi:hypothetical protein
MRKRHIMPIGMISFSLMTAGMLGCRKSGGKDDKPTPEGYTASELQKPATSSDVIASFAPRKSCQGLAPYKIVGGQVVSEKSQVAAATVKLLIRGQKYCTATLIGPQHLVTAAHCVSDIKDPAEIRIASGVDGKTQEKLQVNGIKLHPQYVGILANDQGYLNQPIYDVAALTFRGTLPPHLVPVSLARPEEIQVGMPVIVSGYGAYGSDDKTRRPLTLVETRLSRVEAGLMELQIASGEGRGACFGDSGGPTFVVDSASSCLLLIGSTTGPGRNTDYSCESGGGTLMDLTRYQSWLSCAYKNLNQPHQELVASVNPTVACDSK